MLRQRRGRRPPHGGIHADISDALAAAHCHHPRIRRKIGTCKARGHRRRGWLHKKNPQPALLFLSVRFLAMHHFEIVDAVERRVRPNQLPPVFVATEVTHFRTSAKIPRPSVVACAARHTAPARARWSLRSRRLRLRGRSRRRAIVAARPAPRIAWPRPAPGCSARKPIAGVQLPKVGRFTRSPGAVKSTCSMMSRM